MAEWPVEVGCLVWRTRSLEHQGVEVEVFCCAEWGLWHMTWTPLLPGGARDHPLGQVRQTDDSTMVLPVMARPGGARDHPLGGDHPSAAAAAVEE